MDIIIVAPSLDPTVNVSGVSAVANFIIHNNPSRHYLHFQQGKGDTESGHLISRASRICRTYRHWKSFLSTHPDSLVHYNFPLDAPSILRDYWFMALAVRKKRKMVVHIHGGLYLFKTKRPWVINRLLKCVFQWGLPVIVQSDKEEAVLKNDFKAEKVQVLANCIDLGDAQTFKREPCLHGPLEIVYLGRIEPNKGMDDMLKAAEMLKRRGVNFRLHLAGKEQTAGAYIPRFEKALGSQFVYEGIVSGAKKEQLMKKCQVFLLPSLYEGLPMSLLECMSYGMVPVTTNVGSISTVVENGKNGFLVHQKDADSIVTAITTIDQDRQQMNEMGLLAQSTIIHQFSPQQYITTLNHIYDSEVKTHLH